MSCELWLRRSWLLSACLAASLGLTACATAPIAYDAPLTGTANWQGRLSVLVQTDPPQSSTASFALQGNARTGELQFFSPLGTTVAKLQWREGLVHLHRGQEPERFASMEELTEQLTGSALPVTALFDWLQGQAHEVPGWQADLSSVAQGTLTARRQHPAPTVMLRIKIDP